MKVRLISALLLCGIVLSMCACSVRIDPPRELSDKEEAQNMGFSAVEYDSKVQAGEYKFLSVNIKPEYASEVKWSSDNPEVATVDSGGRVDGIKEGTAIVTATAKKATVDYKIQVTKAKKATLSYSTAFSANENTLKINKERNDEKNLYAIIVNEYNCSVTVFTYNTKNYYNKPVRAMVCSTAKTPMTDSSEDSWITASITDKAQWVMPDDGKYYRYATYIGDNIMFQSSPYSEENAGTLISEEYNKIGTRATAKNIRLSVADAKWIYDNCKEGTTVRFVNSDYKDYYYPLGVPKAMRLTENSKSLNYDPTDSTEGNPYLGMKPIISGTESVEVKLGKGIDLHSGVTAVDTCSNDITSDIRVDGDFDCKVEGRYVVSYYATDSMGRTARVDREVTVSTGG